MGDLESSDFSDTYTTSPSNDQAEFRSEYNYSNTANALESSIAASAAPTTRYPPGCETDYTGLSASAATPVGGAVVELGFYSDCYGMIGGYFSAGTALGIQGLFLGIVTGKTQSLAGDSISLSGSVGPPELPIAPSALKGFTYDPHTGQATGSFQGVGLSVGPPLGGSFGQTTTTTTEFTNLYLDYIQFLNWVGYPGGYNY